VAKKRRHGGEAGLRGVEAEEMTPIGGLDGVYSDDTGVAKSDGGCLDVAGVVVTDGAAPRLDGSLARRRRDSTRSEGLLGGVRGLLVDRGVAEGHRADSNSVRLHAGGELEGAAEPAPVEFVLGFLLLGGSDLLTLLGAVDASGKLPQLARLRHPSKL